MGGVFQADGFEQALDIILAVAAEGDAFEPDILFGGHSRINARAFDQHAHSEFVFAKQLIAAARCL